MEDLTEAVRTLNVVADDYLPGTMTSWTNGGHILAVPVSQVPWGVVWRTDAFATAGISPPTADWILVGDFAEKGPIPQYTMRALPGGHHNATTRPAMASSGTGPKSRLSVLALRWSPMT